MEAEPISSVCRDRLTNKRLIENSFPLETVSKVGSKERYLHGKTAHSLFVWWARRPFSAMRSVILTSLLPLNDSSMTDELELAEELSASIIPSSETTHKTRNLLIEKYGHAPRILDIFGGGGTIAVEAGRIGCEAHSLDINPLAHFIQKSLLEFSQTRADLPELVDKYGKKVLDKLKIETAQLYRRGSSDNPFQQHIAFLWGANYSLLKSFL